MNLDRFSVPMDFEKGFAVVDESMVEVEETLACCGCGDPLYVGEEEILASDIWEDEYLHNDKACIASYYKKNEAAVVSRSIS